MPNKQRRLEIDCTDVDKQQAEVCSRVRLNCSTISGRVALSTACMYEKTGNIEVCGVSNFLIVPNHFNNALLNRIFGLHCSAISGILLPRKTKPRD